MTRRRRLLVLLAVVAFLLGAGAWWLSIDPALSAAERRLVGAWAGPASAGQGVQRFDPDRTAVWSIVDRSGTTVSRRYLSRWRLRDSLLTVDTQDNLVIRILQPLGRAMKLTAHSVEVRLEMPTDDQMIVIWPNGDRETWTRVPEK